MAKNPPEKDYLKALADSLEKKYQARTDLLKDLDDFCRLRKRVVIPQEYAQLGKIAEYQCSAVGDLQRRATDLVAATLPTPHVPPVGTSRDSQNNADLRETWLMGVYDQVLVPVWFKSVESLMRGLSVVQLDLRLHRWGSIRKRAGEDAGDFNDRVTEGRRKESPFTARHVAPETYFPVRVEEGKPMEVMEVTRRDALPLGRQFGLRPDAGGKPVKIDDVGEVNLSDDRWPVSWRFIEWWDEDFAVYMVEDQIVQTVEHHYGRAPYFHAYLYESSNGKPEDEVTPISFSLMPEAQKLSELITARMNHAYLTGFPYRQWKAVNYEAVAEGGAPAATKVGLGGELVAPPGWEYGYVVPPPVGQDMQVMQQYFAQNVERLSLAPVLSGMESGGTSNAATLTMISAAKALFEPGIKNLLRSWNDMAGFLQWLVEKRIKVPVPIYYEGGGKWLELGPKDIDKYYRVTHTLEPMVPGERYQKMLAWADAQARGGVDMNFWREEGLGIHNPLDMDRKVRQEQMRQTPQYTNTLMAEVLKAIQWGLQQAIPELAPPPAQPPVGPGGNGATVLGGVQQGLGSGLGPGGGSPMMVQPQGIPSAPAAGPPGGMMPNG